MGEGQFVLGINNPCILPKCKMVHYVNLTNISLILPIVIKPLYICVPMHFSKLSRICITVHFCQTVQNLYYGAFSLTIFVHNCPHKSQVAAAGFPLLHFARHHLCPGFVQRRAHKSFLYNFSSWDPWVNN